MTSTTRDRDRPLTIVVPVYDEAANIGPLVDALERHIAPPFTAVVVYDRDEDTTLPPARALMATRPWLSLLKNDLGQGVLYALKTGLFSVERGPVLVVMGDLSDDLAQVGAMLALYRAGCDVVVASRYMRGGRQIGGPLWKRVLSQGAGLSLALAGFPVKDATNNFRLYDAGFVREAGIDSAGGFEVALELVAKAHRLRRRVGEVPATWHDRTAGESRFRLRKWLPHYLRWYVFALTGRDVRRRADVARR